MQALTNGLPTLSRQFSLAASLLKANADDAEINPDAMTKGKPRQATENMRTGKTPGRIQNLLCMLRSNCRRQHASNGEQPIIRNSSSKEFQVRRDRMTCYWSDPSDMQSNRFDFWTPGPDLGDRLSRWEQLVSARPLLGPRCARIGRGL